MEDTGRIKRTLHPSIRKKIFGATADAAVEAELLYGCQVDRAHLVMLVRRGLLARAAGSRLLGEIEALIAGDFQPLRGRHAPRGLYLLYENYLGEKLGHQIGGMLQLGRSRNDRGATVLRLRLRRPFRALVAELLRLQFLLLRKAAEHRDAVMPVYTHYQAAMPVSYGHYLAGLASALQRDLEGIGVLAGEMDRSPLGAGAAGGTSVAIDPALSAELLGFVSGPGNSIDAVASRDLALRLLAAAAILGVTLSRAAADLLLWTTQEFGFLELPDELVGSSSMMPQKRNVFLLEHVAGRSAAPLGAFVQACAAMRGAPYSNSIAVGTEGVAELFRALEQARDCVLFLRRLIAEAQPRREVMESQALRGMTFATTLAEQLVLRAGLSFRDAHHRVGEAVAAALGGDGVALERLRREAAPDSAAPADLLRLERYGGAAWSAEARLHLQELRARAGRLAADLRGWKKSWRAAQELLDRAVQELARSRA